MKKILMLVSAVFFSVNAHAYVESFEGFITNPKTAEYFKEGRKVVQVKTANEYKRLRISLETGPRAPNCLSHFLSYFRSDDSLLLDVDGINDSFALFNIGLDPNLIQPVVKHLDKFPDFVAPDIYYEFVGESFDEEYISDAEVDMAFYVGGNNQCVFEKLELTDVYSEFYYGDELIDEIEKTAKASGFKPISCKFIEDRFTYSTGKGYGLTTAVTCK